MNDNKLYYGDYLHLDQILAAQELMSARHGQPVHDEMFFIILHQTFELWFKELLVELDSVCALFANCSFPGSALATIHARLSRITAIQKLLLQQLNLLQTLTPADFLEFREYLNPSSGFQSVQFRLMELQMGADIDEAAFTVYLGKLNSEDQIRLRAARQKKSLFTLVNEWLEQLSVCKTEEYDFLAAYRDAQMRHHKETAVAENVCSHQMEKRRATCVAEQASTDEKCFAQLFSPADYEKNRAMQPRCLSHQAIVHALFIEIYHEQPLLQLPFQVLQLLIEMDELFTTWRFQHVLMVQRMIGVKTGTGGSSGYSYLQATIEKYRIFTDLTQVATYLLPRRYIPNLPAEVVALLGFNCDDATVLET